MKPKAANLLFGPVAPRVSLPWATTNPLNRAQRITRGTAVGIEAYDTKLLRLFASSVKARGFAAAQSELNLSLSTISGHVSALEARLGLVLCRLSGFSMDGLNTQPPIIGAMEPVE